MTECNNLCIKSKLTYVFENNTLRNERAYANIPLQFHGFYSRQSDKDVLQKVTYYIEKIRIKFIKLESDKVKKCHHEHDKCERTNSKD